MPNTLESKHCRVVSYPADRWGTRRTGRGGKGNQDNNQADQFADISFLNRRNGVSPFHRGWGLDVCVALTCPSWRQVHELTQSGPRLVWESSGWLCVWLLEAPNTTGRAGGRLFIFCGLLISGRMAASAFTSNCFSVKRMDVSCGGLEWPLGLLALDTVGLLVSWWTSMKSPAPWGWSRLTTVGAQQTALSRPHYGTLQVISSCRMAHPLVQPGIELGAADKCDRRVHRVLVISGNSES
ncbi:uncharacterized protein B0H64DRAFT_8686 [Chaetomium fimeti]|uniref:Uncharacterized protein n=1 Tax=Chaetomium fimeti TaxID=1854472 RepID=A0AAE0HP52_9PEZI|nr:hypothetical protein B0H64DRAFT_8686 [Chaetomium fimeti]